MDYFLWGYIKNKLYVKNYENISDLKAALISAFQEVSHGMVTLIMENFIVMFLCLVELNLDVLCRFWAQVDESRTNGTRVIKVLKVDT